MAIIPEVKCGKCDRYYKAYRATCPVCGARRGAQNKHAKEIDNMRGKMIVYIAILAALIIAVVFIATMPPFDVEYDPPASAYPSIPDNSGDVHAVPGASPTPGGVLEPSAPPTEAPTPEPVVTFLEIRYLGNRRTEFTAGLNETVPLTVAMLPEGIDVVPEWTSSNTAVFDVVPTDTTGLAANVTITGRGANATLTVTAGDQTVTCIVRARR